MSNQVYSTKTHLPPFGRYVLCHHTRGTWRDSSDQEGVNWVVLKRVPAEVWGNNNVPYKWEEFGPDSFFGQDIDKWCEIPRGSDADVST
jgi:hypothetical protein